MAKQPKHVEHTPLNLGLASFSVILVLALSIFALATQEQRISSLMKQNRFLSITLNQEERTTNQVRGERISAEELDTFHRSQQQALQSVLVNKNNPQNMMEAILIANSSIPTYKSANLTYTSSTLLWGDMGAIDQIKIAESIKSKDGKSILHTLTGHPNWDENMGRTMIVGFFVEQNGNLALYHVSPQGLYTGINWLNNTTVQTREDVMGETVTSTFSL